MISVNLDHYLAMREKAQRVEDAEQLADYNYELLRAERRKTARLRWRLEQIREALEEVSSV